MFLLGLLFIFVSTQPGWTSWTAWSTMAGLSPDDNLFALIHLPFFSSSDNTNNQPNILSAFHLFSHLPPELRLRIWELASSKEVVPRTWSNRQFDYFLKRKVPPVLQVCREARNFLIRDEQAQISTNQKYQLIWLRETKERGAYINWALDEVQIYRGCMGIRVLLSIRMAC